MYFRLSSPILAFALNHVGSGLFSFCVTQWDFDAGV
ncbi:hypothetical protein CHELA40_14255 [Chelatococcus asaccharovorans]|nr:hypothetical protein CHELA17_61365 [Chelatococcus asaccharovorans]CAH1676253.1 hypothetical protein CHELA40_14255 [Chelatococcus asaccharovorans]